MDTLDVPVRNRAGSTEGSDASTPPSWDGPPSTEPPTIVENRATMVLVLNRRLQHMMHREVLQLGWSHTDRHLAVRTHLPSEHHDRLQLWDTTSWTIFNKDNSAWSALADKSQGISLGRVQGGFAFTYPPDNAIAWPSPKHVDYLQQKYNQPYIPHLEIYDLGNRKGRSNTDHSVQAPLVFSPDGKFLAAALASDPSRIIIVSVAPPASPQLGRVIPHHLAEVTHLAFLPDSVSVVSLSRDGCARITALYTGKTLFKLEIETRHAPSLLQVSPDGKLVASIWGRQVVLWYPEPGEMTTYNFDSVRQTEGWPLAISPDCKYLACRTEEGFDISDLATGRFCGEGSLERSFPTAAAFSNDGKWLAIGRWDSDVCLYEIIVA